MLMKKFLLAMLMAVTTVVAMAKTYTDNLVVSVNGESTKAMKRTDAMGQTISYVEVELSKGEKACCSVK